jgi:hypothetical protein
MNILASSAPADEPVREVEHYDLDAHLPYEPQALIDMRIQHAAWERMWVRRYANDPDVSDVDFCAAYHDLSFRLVRRLAQEGIRLTPHTRG